MEAIDLFRNSYNIDNQMLEAKFLLTQALIYRLIYGEQEEFLENMSFIVNLASGKRYPQNMTALYHYALICIELKKMGLEIITDDQFYESVCRLCKFPESKMLIKAIRSEMESIKK